MYSVPGLVCHSAVVTRLTAILAKLPLDHDMPCHFTIDKCPADGPSSATTEKRKPLDSDDELDSGAIKDKTAKIAYLDKLVALVGVCSGHDINVRPSKVVAGLEPEGTNALLAVREQMRIQAASVVGWPCVPQGRERRES